MKRTLQLVFVHGFQGNDETFGDFPQHLQALLSHALPHINIVTAVYPSFETRGDLGATVTRYREWLLDRVINLELEQETASPTVEPGVKTILVGHSMGGIVNAEAVLGIVKDMDRPPIGSHVPKDRKWDPLFPNIQGVLSFDTPYLGIAPSVLARGAEDQWAASKAWYDSTMNYFTSSGQPAGAASAGTGASPAAAASAESGAPSVGSAAAGAASAAAAAETATTAQATTPAWQRWGKIALMAGAAGAIAAGAGTAAILNHKHIAGGWSWATSHLEFVGCLARGEELKQRLDGVVALKDRENVGFANIYTLLGAGAEAKSSSAAVTWAARAIGGDYRTFCNLPKDSIKKHFYEAKNERATGEIDAHMYMFTPKDNPGYFAMGEQAKELILSWMDHGWLEDDALACD